MGQCLDFKVLQNDCKLPPDLWINLLLLYYRSNYILLNYIKANTRICKYHTNTLQTSVLNMLLCGSLNSVCLYGSYVDTQYVDTSLQIKLLSWAYRDHTIECNEQTLPRQCTIVELVPNTHKQTFTTTFHRLL